jgi:ferritin-like metal-binding protein YciE
MKNLCRVVGTRFLVHGSLDADSSSGLLIELRVVDAPSGFEITSQIESFKKNPSLLGAQVLDFTEKILQKVTAALSTGKVIQEPLQFMQSDTLITAQPVKKKPEQMINSIVPNDTQSVSRTGKLEIDTAGNGRNELAADNQQSQAIKQSQSNSFDDSTTVNNVVRNVNPIPDTLVNPGNNNVVIAKSISDGTDTVNNTVLLNDTQTSIVGLISTNSTEEHIDTNETESNPTIVAQVLKPDDGTSITSTKSSVSEQTTIIAQTVGPVAPSEALNSKPKGNSFKKLRIASFGIITMAGCIGGIITNGVIKKSLDEESALYKVYMKANAEQTEETYQRYVSQTDKTDAKIRQRSLLYALGVLGLTACTVSIRF